MIEIKERGIAKKFQQSMETPTEEKRNFKIMFGGSFDRCTLAAAFGSHTVPFTPPNSFTPPTALHGRVTAVRALRHPELKLKMPA